ncbi:hypothetical protein QBC37DRAFT_487906 [Rhypophila decipiens]|uniref:Uncharacterized protein n=1 Tax=Rhypophila decipiens TaxID=261697 RepID=A0AAN6XU86_9PEZI|nr:hypothetical protein QBC37DRAFT_487906 [Rhypophila decipiens]
MYPKTITAFLLMAGTTVAVSLPHQTTSTVNLGTIQFAAPFCGNAKLHSINTTDCFTALSGILSSICTTGVCWLPAGNPPFTGSLVTRTVGMCEIFIETNVESAVVTFSQASVQDEFDTFIPQCVDPSNQIHNGNPVVRSVDGRFSLLFSNGLAVGPE